jgi:hypothetical protein
MVLLSDDSRDVVAILSLILAVIQTILTVAQMRHIRASRRKELTSATLNTGRRQLIMQLSAAGASAALAMFVFALLLDTAVTTFLYLLKLPPRPLDNAVDTSYAYLLVVPGSTLESTAIMVFFESLTDVVGARRFAQRIRPAIVLLCAGSIYYLVVLWILAEVHTVWCGLFAMTQRMAWAMLVPGVLYGVLPDSE